MFLAGPIRKENAAKGELEKKRLFVRDALKLDPDRCVGRLLERRVIEFHSDARGNSDGGKDLGLMLKCLGGMRFSDRPLTDREKLTVLAICRCYDPSRWQRTLINWCGYVKSKRSDELDLPLMLTDFRARARELLDVNRYGLFETARLKGVDG